MDSNVKYAVHTFGCKVNTYDTGLIQKNLQAQGFSASEKPKVHVLNTCAVTAEATKQAVRLIRKIKASDPFSTVVITGCAAQVDTQTFENLPGADLVVANSHKSELPQILKKYYSGELTQKIYKSNIFKKEDLEAGGGIESAHTRSFLKIQDGCNSFCTYCIIPYARGKSRSIPIFELIRKIKELSEQGVQEVVLTGVHIGDYEDQKFVIEDLLEQILIKTQVPRIRLSSLEPVELSDRMIDLYTDDRMCRHFHMSIQSAQTNVLFDMKRKYTAQDVENSLNKIFQRIPGSYVGMDVIVGFPTETAEYFLESYERLSNLPWTRIHVFPYSERSGTRAAQFDQSVPWEERTKRATQLRELSFSRQKLQAASQVGLIKKTLLLKKPVRGALGLSRDYWPIVLDFDQEKMSHLLGQEVEIKINSVVDKSLHREEAQLLGEWL